jgi:hypothetical protein
MVYFMMVSVLMILAVMVILVLSSAMLLVGRLLGLLFPITTFEGALITTLVALGAILAFLPARWTQFSFYRLLGYAGVLNLPSSPKSNPLS